MLGTTSRKIVSEPKRSGVTPAPTKVGGLLTVQPRVVDPDGVAVHDVV